MYAEPDMTTAGARAGTPQDGGSGPVRTCLVTREAGSAATMIRFVVSPDGDVVPDLAGKLPGRGFWLTARRDIVHAACARNVFAKAARRQVTVPEGLTDLVEDLLARRCLDLVGIARRAGQALSGFEKVRAALRQRRVAVLLVAADGADGGIEKLGAVPHDVERVDLFDAAALGTVFGRDRTVHGAVAPGRIADRLIAEVGRLGGFRHGPHVGKLS